MKNLVKKVYGKVLTGAAKLYANESGDLQSGVWMLGTAIVAALVVVVFLTLGPSTATNLFNSAVTYIQGKLGF